MTDKKQTYPQDKHESCVITAQRFQIRRDPRLIVANGIGDYIDFQCPGQHIADEKSVGKLFITVKRGSKSIGVYVDFEVFLQICESIIESHIQAVPPTDFDAEYNEAFGPRKESIVPPREEAPKKTVFGVDSIRPSGSSGRVPLSARAAAKQTGEELKEYVNPVPSLTSVFNYTFTNRRQPVHTSQVITHVPLPKGFVPRAFSGGNRKK